MITNLFSIFDPCSSIFNFSLNWIRRIIFLLVIFPSIFFFPSLPLWGINTLLKKISEEFRTILQTRKPNLLIFSSLFFFIIINNTFGLVNYAFTSTRHLCTTLALALPLWLRFLIFRIFSNITKFIAHIVPLGTPPALIPFIVLIETVRNIIRPITLSVRLAANIIAGHLLLTLIRGQAPYISSILFLPLFIGQSLLIILEMAVALIQAYVFTILRSLYAAEAH